jgi:hypothetical protein
MKKLFAIAVWTLCISAFAADKLAGTYVNGPLHMTFLPNGAVSTVLMGNPMKTKYQIDGDKVKFQFLGGSPGVFKIMPDGSLNGGINGTYVPKR